MTHKLSSACAELILSYHLFSQQILFTQTGICHVTALGCGFLCFVWVVLVCVRFCFCCFASGSLCFWFLFSDDVTRE